MSDVMVLQRLDDLERRVGRLEVITREFPGEADVAIELKHGEPRGSAFSAVAAAPPGTTVSAAPSGATTSPVSPGAGIEARAVAETVGESPTTAATPLPIPAAADPDFAVAASVAKTPEVAPLSRDDSAPGGAPSRAIAPAGDVSPAAEPGTMDELFVKLNARRGRHAEYPPLAQLEFTAARVEAATMNAVVRKPRENLEMQIGTRWMAWVGAIVVILAVGFFVKLAVDQGWFGLLSPALRCVMAAVFGGVLIAAGEVVLRRVGKIASVGLFGAGLGTLYLTSLATVRAFSPPVLSESAAFVLMAGVAALGIGITIRGRLVVVGVLSLLGGYLAPVLLSNASASAFALPVYLTALLAVAISLAVRRGGEFGKLLPFAMPAHVFLASVWVLAGTADLWWLYITFAAFWWVMLLIEPVFAARAERTAARNVGIAFAATTWFVVLCSVWLARVSPVDRDWIGVFCGATAWVAMAIALYVGRGVSVLRALPASASAKLALAMWAQVGILLAVAVGFHFEDYGKVIGWLVLAIAGIEIGRRLRSDGLTVYGLILGAVAVVRLVVFDWSDAGLETVVVAMGLVQVTGAGLLGLGAIAVTVIAAHRIRWQMETKANQHTPATLLAIALVGWLVLWMMQATGIAITGAWLVAAGLLLAVHSRLDRPRYFDWAGVALVATGARLLLADFCWPRMQENFDFAGSLPFLNAEMGMAVMTAAVAWAYWRVSLRRVVEIAEGQRANTWRTPPGSAAVLLGFLTFALLAISFQTHHAVYRTLGDTNEAARAFQLLLTGIWTVGSIIAPLLSRRGSGAAAGGAGSAAGAVVRIALGLLAMCATKWMLVDVLAASMQWGVGGAMPVANLQAMIGLLIAGALVVLARIMGRSMQQEGRAAAAMHNHLMAVSRWMPVAACGIVLWALSFETDRVISLWESAAPFGWTAVWPAEQLRVFWLIVLWGIGGLAMALYGARRPWQPMLVAGRMMMLVVSLAWITIATAHFRMHHGVALASPVVNMQVCTGLLCGLLLLRVVWQLKREAASGRSSVFDRALAVYGKVTLVVLGLWIGSFEIDRLFSPEAGRFGDGGMARQTALSVYWGVYGIGLLALGFVRRIAEIRYAGLALLGIMLLKVLVVDLAEARYAYRVLSLLAAGLLLIGTSVAYTKLSSRLLAEHGKRDEETTRHG